AGAGDRVKLRALALLGELGRDAPGGTRLDDASAARERSLQELAALLTTAPDIARAGDMVVSRLDPAHMLELVDALSVKEPRRAAALVNELLLRNDVDERHRCALRRIRAPLREPHQRPQAPPGRQPVATAMIGRHPTGKRAIVASRRIPGSRPSQHRA